MTPLFWVASLLVGLVGLNRFVAKREPSYSSGYLDGGIVVVRSTEARHRFPRLGIEVEMPDGWVYLSVTEDSQASRPTFLHQASESVVRLQAFNLQAWPVAGTELAIEEIGDSQIEWSEIDHRRIGRWTQGQDELMISAITHQLHARLNPEVRDLCSKISLIRDPLKRSF